ncbi:MAG TPA: polysaccharide pyruvyl transferase family protein [Mycobacterium sp.]|nr:polysaccharide pyruvyl transferase family protein [Mycobacterium sp.]
MTSTPRNRSSQIVSATTAHRKVLFLGTHGQANVGDELLLDTFLTELGPDNAYAVNSYDPSSTRAQLADRFEVDVFDTGTDRVGLLRNLLRCDVVVFGGGNILKELYQSVGRWKYSTLTMVLAVVFLARLAAKPVAMANIGIGPVDTAPGRVLVRAILRLVWLVSVRDEGSFRFAQSVGCSARKLRLVPDAVWVRDPESLAGVPLPSGRPGEPPLRIAVNLNKDVDAADEWERFLDRLVVALAAVAGARPVEFHALPMQCGFKSGTDLEVLQEVLGRLQTPVVIHTPATHQDVAAIITDCHLVVSERLHAIILAVVLGRPVVALPYDVKVRELVTQLGLRKRSFAVSADLDPLALAAAILDTVDDAGAEGKRLAAVAAAKRAEAESGFATLRSWVAAPARTWELPNA